VEENVTITVLWPRVGTVGGIR